MDTLSPITLSPGAPHALPPGSVWAVTAGVVEAYLVWPGGRRLLCVANTGDVVVAPTKDATAQIVGSEGATLETVEPRPDQIERFIEAACADLVLPPPPPEAVIGGETLFWVTVGTNSVAVAGVDLPVATVPVIGALWVDPAVPRIDGESLHEQGTLGAAAADFTGVLARLHTHAAAAVDTAALRRLGLTDDQQTEAAGVTSDAFGPMAPAEAISALATVLKADGATAAGPPDDAPSVPRLARMAGLRARPVRLAPGWWAEDHGPLIVSLDHGLLPLIRDARGYVLPGGHRPDAGDLARCGMQAHAVSRALPDCPASVWSLAALALSGAGADVALITVAAIAVSTLGVLTPLATGWLFADIVPSGEFGLLIAVGLALATASLVSTALGVVRALASARLDGRGALAVSAALSDRLLKLPTGFFRGYAAGDLNQRLENVETLRALGVSVLLTSGLSAITSLVYLGALLVYDARLSLIALGLVAVYAVAVLTARLLQRGPMREAAEIDGRISALTFETLSGIGKLRAAAAEGRAMARWARLYATERTVNVRAGRVGVHFEAFADAYQTLTLLTLFMAAGLVGLTDAPAGVFIAFLAAFGAFQGAFVAFTEALLEVFAAEPLAERARPVLSAEPETARGRADPGRLQGEIEVANLAFTYPGAAPVLTNLSFRVRPGEHLAIVGGSGSGKSTVLRLLLGFETPERGAITYDGQDLTQLDLAALRAQIGVVLQSSDLFAGSILDNIRGASDAGLERCLDAAAKAGLARDLDVFAMGIHTPITDGAASLSGGQRQRVLIARALAAEPQILFFDEATSALDNATQALVARTLDSLDVTRITIAHRLSTVRNADRICVLDEGRFVEAGPYDDLMAANGAFARLARRQLTE